MDKTIQDLVKPLRGEVKCALENCACIGRNPGDYTEYVEKMTTYLMKRIEEVMSSKGA